MTQRSVWLVTGTVLSVIMCSVITLAQAGRQDGKTDVERQLQELYRRDGREMPSMRLNEIQTTQPDMSGYVSQPGQPHPAMPGQQALEKEEKKPFWSKVFGKRPSLPKAPSFLRPKLPKFGGGKKSAAPNKNDSIEPAPAPDFPNPETPKREPRNRVNLEQNGSKIETQHTVRNSTGMPEPTQTEIGNEAAPFSEEVTQEKRPERGRPDVNTQNEQAPGNGNNEQLPSAESSIPELSFEDVPQKNAPTTREQVPVTGNQEQVRGEEDQEEALEIENPKEQRQESVATPKKIKVRGKDPRATVEISDPEEEENPFSGLTLEVPGNEKAEEAAPQENAEAPGVAVSKQRPGSKEKKIKIDLGTAEEASSRGNQEQTPVSENSSENDPKSEQQLSENENKDQIPELSLEEETEEAPVAKNEEVRIRANNEQVPAEPKSRDAKIQERLAKLASSPKKEGFKGFCPVMLRNFRELIEANEEFKSVYHSKTYYFSCQAAKDDFETNPMRFVPAGDGHDLVEQVDHEETVEGTLDFAVWFRGKLFMFKDQENLDEFVESPEDYALHLESPEDKPIEVPVQTGDGSKSNVPLQGNRASTVRTNGPKLDPGVEIFDQEDSAEPEEMIEIEAPENSTPPSLKFDPVGAGVMPLPKSKPLAAKFRANNQSSDLRGLTRIRDTRSNDEEDSVVVLVGAEVEE